MAPAVPTEAISAGLALHGLAPTTLLVLAGVAGTGLAALHFFRRRPRRLVVPALWLWAPGAGETRAERWARRLRRVGSLLLQWLILSLLLTAAGDPSWAPRGASPRSVVVLIDRSASMSASDEPGTRLGRALTLALTVIDGLEPGDRALVACFAAHFFAATGFEGDRGKLKAAVNAIPPSDEPGDLAGALASSAALLRDQPGPSVVLIGDGGGAAGDDTIAQLERMAQRAKGAKGTNDGPVALRFLPVGRRRDNLAIVAFSAQRRPIDRAVGDLVVVTESFRSVPADVTLAFSAGPAHIPLARRTVHLDPGARVVSVLSAIRLPDPRLEAVIEDAHDDLALDDRAFAAVAPDRPRKVLVVGPADLYLDAALLGMSGDVQVDRRPAAAARTTDDGSYDVVIFDGVTPPEPPERGRFLFIDPHGAGSPWSAPGIITDPLITEVRREHPLVKQLGLADLNVTAARRLILQEGDVAVASSLGSPLIVARQRPGLRAVGLAFDLRQSDLPLRSAFPLLISNVLGWLTERPPDQGLSHGTGQTVRIAVAKATSSGDRPGLVDLVGPDRRVVRLPVVDGAVTVSLDRAGIFEVVGLDAPPSGGDGDGDGARPVTFAAASLASPSESDLEPRRALGRHEPSTPEVAAKASQSSGTDWRIGLVAVLAALALVVLEWVALHRRAPVT